MEDEDISLVTMAVTSIFVSVMWLGGHVVRKELVEENLRIPFAKVLGAPYVAALVLVNIASIDDPELSDTMAEVSTNQLSHRMAVDGVQVLR